jgi:predicted nucleotidyltransferase
VFKPANIQDRSEGSEPEVHGEIEVKIWRCTKIRELPTVADAPHVERANSKHNVKPRPQSRWAHIASLERVSTHNRKVRKRKMKKAEQRKI